MCQTILSNKCQLVMDTIMIHFRVWCIQILYEKTSKQTLHIAHKVCWGDSIYCHLRNKTNYRQTNNLENIQEASNKINHLFKINYYYFYLDLDAIIYFKNNITQELTEKYFFFLTMTLFIYITKYSSFF